ncbi:uncharacterized protein C7orf50 homolog [Euwallacea similis]|uniref:uncharacterized protein C7orf50 homolog n=1 Tax=Euwallacea similis TaxID=1736056 RepID=UPI00344E5E36
MMGRKMKKSKISFEAETVTKDHAKRIISEIAPKAITKLWDDEDLEAPLPIRPKKKRQRSIPDEQIPPAKKSHNLESEKPIEEEVQTSTKNTEKKESNRSKKKKKHAQLQEEQRLKGDLEMQQKALNYLSKWKHNRSEWKFEKLRQIWLQQYLLDVNKIPGEFWDSAVQYFSGSKGHSRQVVLDNAVKVIEEDERVSEENRTEDYSMKLKRARDIIQNLQ